LVAVDSLAAPASFQFDAPPFLPDGPLSRHCSLPEPAPFSFCVPGDMSSLFTSTSFLSHWDMTVSCPVTSFGVEQGRGRLLFGNLQGL
jgi:hypothetical protein